MDNANQGQEVEFKTQPAAGVSPEDTAEMVSQIVAGVPPEEIRSKGIKEAVQQFNGLEVDEKLAVLYYLYAAMGTSVTPAAIGAADLDFAKTFFDEFDALPMGEAQLDVMRALVRGDDSSLCQRYSSLVENNKLALWYILAERMGDDVIDMPADYKLTDIGKQNIDAVKQLDFEQQITFLRDVVEDMGSRV
jgi:Orange carotenoid protein, N-terminal